MQTTTMNIRVSKNLKENFEKVVQANGLDSSTAIRVLMLEYSKGKFDIGIRNILDNEIEQGKNEYRLGRYISAKTNKEIDQILE